MISLGDAILTIKGDTTGLSKAEGEVGSIMGTVKQHSLAIGAAITGVGAAITGGLGLAVGAFADSEAASAQLEAVLKSTKGAAGMTAESIQALSTELSRMTPFEDDAITAGQSMLLTFTNIGKDVFPEVTRTMLDMSQALGQDLKSSAMQLGKALNDPIAGVSALQRVGVSFTESQKAQIETLVKSGQTMQAQKLILSELSTEFGGSAAAAAGTLTGKWTQLKNEFGSMMEEIGSALTGGGGFKGLLDMIKGMVISTTDWIKNHSELTKIIVVSIGVIGGLATVLGPLIIALPGIVTAFGLLGSAAAALTGVGGIGALGIAFGALTGPVGLAGIALLALTPLIWGVGKAIMGVTEAERQQAESQAKVDAMTQRYIETLRARGLVIDEVKMKEMDDAQKAQYLTQLKIEAKEKETSSIIRLLTGAEATKQQIFNSELARTALDLNAKEAVFFASKGYTSEQIKDMKQLTEAQKTEIRKQLDAEIAAWLKRDATMQQALVKTEKTTSEMQLYLDRLSLDHHESPSINDNVRTSIFGGSGLMSIFGSMLQPMKGVLDSMWKMWTGTWESICDYIGKAVAWAREQARGVLDLVRPKAEGGIVVDSAKARGGIVGMAGGGMATILAGEEGPELGITPGGQAGILGANGPGIFRVPVGTEISTAAETSHLRLSNVPNFLPDVTMPRGGAGGGAGNTTVSISSPITVSVARLDASNPAEIAKLARVISREWETQIQSTLKGRGFRLSTT
ncbi:MAG: phage tail length tape measure family protein [Candidatus Hydrogenedentes bacterium]|nr:phage tail length tape measure family protein [Candidatus Hydrogenedentota bacterium]